MTPMLDDRLLDLLVKRATEGVSAEEQSEMDRLGRAHREADLESIEQAAAALALAAVNEEPLPANVRARLERSAEQFVSGRRAQAPRRSGPSSRPSPSARFAWFALAASVVLAVLGWWPRLSDDAPGLTLAEQRRELIEKGRAAVRGDWIPPGDPATNPVSGDVVWDSQTQQGFMRFTGLQANDPQQFQYQLWIFDAGQDQRYPIDGGVFDIPAGQGEIIVPIRAGIGVKTPVMFAVTAEKPGGVVVSSREQIVALAKVVTG
jgi:hypothetical protein